MERQEEPLIDLRGVTKRFGEHRAVDGVSLQVRRGEFFSLLGSSGCGKSTLLRLIAGFETADAGEIRVNGRDAKAAPAYATELNMVFQNYALFPHMTVAENVAFGLRMAKVKKPERDRRVAEMLELVRMTEYASRAPSRLSGGQQQRVALARALAPGPSAVLLDEPLGALDLQLRREMQHELKRIQRETGLTFLYVTHDQEEALGMSDRLCVMSGGRAMQTGSPEEIYHRPNCRFVAGFIGECNLLNGRVVATRENGAVLADVDGLKIEAAGGGRFAVGERVALALRPGRVRLRENAGGLPEVNAASGVVERTVFAGGGRMLHATLANGLKLRVLRPEDAGPPPGAGEPVAFSWPAEAVWAIRETD